MLGSVMTVTGSQMTVQLDDERLKENAVRVGSMVTASAGDRTVVGTIGAVQLINGATKPHILVVDLVGEMYGENGTRRFTRGVSHHPVPGIEVHPANDDDLGIVFAKTAPSTIRIGTLYDNDMRPAFVQIDELLGKHFAVIGSSGSGKSCTVALILSAILNEHPGAHVLMLDPHNEYATAFGDLAETLSVDNLKLPFWMCDSEEAVRVLVRGGTPPERESQAIILRDIVARARRSFAGDGPETASITVDTPVPYRLSDLVRFLNEAAGKLDKADSPLPYLRLRNRIESLRGDKRYAFMFHEGLNIEDRLPDVIGRLMRIPVNGKPIAVLDLSGVPSEITDVVVSLCCRIIFDFAVWAPREEMPPILIACEEAHRYVPADDRVGFAATARAITRIAKEGRKYRLALALISQRPSELSPEALSQCGTVFALRLANELDQEFVARTVPDAARQMLAALPSLPTQQAIIAGEGVPMPMRVKFDDLPASRRPRSEGARFSRSWQVDTSNTSFRDDALRRWRTQTR